MRRISTNSLTRSRITTVYLVWINGQRRCCWEWRRTSVGRISDDFSPHTDPPPGNFWLNFLFYECDVFDIRTVKDFFLTSHRAYLMSIYVSNFFLKFSFQVVNYQVFRLMHKIHCYKDMQHSLYLYNSVNYASLTERCVYYGKFINRKWRIWCKKKKMQCVKLH